MPQHFHINISITIFSNLLLNLYHFLLPVKFTIRHIYMHKYKIYKYTHTHIYM